MDCRNINVFERGLDNLRTKPQAYIFLDKIPPETYQDILQTIKEEDISLDNFSVSLSTEDGSEVFKLTSERGRGKGYFGILELELRGAFLSYDGGVLKINPNAIPVCHCVLDDFAVCIVETGLLDKVTFEDIKHYVEKELGVTVEFQEVESDHIHNGMFPQVTKFFTKTRELESFYKELSKEDRVRNIITGELTLDSIINDINNRETL